MENASGVSAARSSRDDGAGAEGAEGGLTLGLTSGSTWWLVGGDGGVIQGDKAASRPLGGSGGQSFGEMMGGLNEEGDCGSVGGQEYSSVSRSDMMVPTCSSIAWSVALGGWMLSLAMVAWMELMGRSPPRTMSCCDSCLT